MIEFYAQISFDDEMWKAVSKSASTFERTLRDAVETLDSSALLELWPDELRHVVEIRGRLLMSGDTLTLEDDLVFTLSGAGVGSLDHLQVLRDEEAQLSKLAGFPRLERRCPGCGRPRPPHAPNCNYA